MRVCARGAQRRFSRALLSIWQDSGISGEIEVMTSRRKRFGIGAGRCSRRRRSAHRPRPSSAAPPAASARARARASGRAARRRISATASTSSAAASTAGSASPCARSTTAGATGWKADELYPQQSVSKLWVSITALDAVDKGRVSLDDQVTLTRDDLTLFHQPIARADPRRRLHDDARRPDVQGDHHQRQYRQRQADALGRRAAGGARR